jgi:hypothetical protein
LKTEKGRKNNSERGRKNNPVKRGKNNCIKFCLLVSLYISLPIPLLPSPFISYSGKRSTRHRHPKNIMVVAGIEPMISAC